MLYFTQSCIGGENNELKKVWVKNRTYYYVDDLVKLEDVDFDNSSLNKKSSENILVYDVSYKTLISAKSLRILFNKVDV